MHRLGFTASARSTLLTVAVLATPVVLRAQQAATPPTQAPTVAPPTGGPQVAQPGGATPAAPALPPLQVKVLLDVDYVSQEPLTQPPNLGFGLRRARLFAQLNGPAGLAFRLQFDPTSLTNGPQGAAPFRGVPLVEAYLDLALPYNVLVRAGQQRVPFAVNAVTGGPQMPAPEYTQLSRYTVQRTSAFRDIGVTLNGRAGPLEYVGGVFNGGGINTVTDNDSTRDYAGRLSWAVLPGVQVGGSAWTGHTGALYVRNVGAAPIKSFFDNADFHRSAVDLHVGRGALDVAAEYGRERLDYNVKALNPTPNKTALERSGYDVTAALRLGALVPALHRVEAVGRYDRWDPNRTVANDHVTEYTAGLNFYLQQAGAPIDKRLGRTVNFVQRQSRLMAFWEFDRPEALGPAAPAGALLNRRTQRFHARWELF